MSKGAQFGGKTAQLATLIVNRKSLQFSFMLSTRFFFGLSLDRCPLP